MLVLLALLLLQAHRAEGYGTGPPPSACDSMTPSHGPAAQTGISPYQLMVAKNTYSPSEQIQVTLNGTSTFSGFMIQPRLQNSASTATYGTITPNDNVNTNNPCSAEKAALAHKNRVNDRTSVSFVWTAPSTDVGTIVFLYTVVQVKATFWVKLESSPLSYQAPSQAPTTQEPTTQAPTTQEPTTQAPTSQKPTTQAPTTQEPTTQAPTTQEPTIQAPTTQEPTTQAPTSQEPTTQAPTTQEPTIQAPTTQEPTTQAPTSQKPTTHAPTTQEPTTQAPTTQGLATQIDRDPNCGVSLNCFPAMDECSTNCDYLVTWREVSDTDVEFSLKRKTTNNNYYIAIGFSEDLQMGDDSVVQCVSTDGAVGVKSSYNVPGADKYNDDLDEITFGVSLISGSYSDGVLSCTFNRKKDADLASAGSARRRRATSNASSFFNLTKEYFLLVALGEAFGGSISQHSEKPKISTTKIDFLALPDVNNTETTTAVATKTGKITRDDGCGKNLGCFHDGCKGGECDFLLTWKDVGDDVELSFSCKMSKNGYCAIGLSSDEKMGDDSVFECVSDGSIVNVYVSYNNGRSNSRLDQDQYGLSSITTSGNNGVITCSFRRQKVAPSRRKRASSGKNTFFDMNSDWTLMFAHGSASAGYLSQHATTPLVSKQVADFQSFQEIGADSADRVLIKLHGILMVLAWMLLASIGITMARFYKEVWPEGMEWFQLKRWFVIHRACMVCVFLLTAVSFVVIFIHVGGFAEISGTDFEKSHPIIGIVVMALTVINPIMAFFRPHPGTQKRQIFNYAHLGVGSGAHVLSVINIFSGALLASEFLTANAEIIVWTFVAWMIIFYLLQHLQECFTKKEKQTKYEMKTFDESMKESPKKRVNNIKIGLLIVHVFVVVGLSLAVVVMIAVE